MAKIPLTDTSRSIVSSGAPKFILSVKGIGESLGNLKKAKKSIKNQAVKALTREAKEILALAKANTPVDTGRLKKSGRLFKPKINKQGFVQFEIAFGGIKVSAPAGKWSPGGSRFVDYAVVVHETHKTKSKFLAKAVKAKAPGLAKRIASQIKMPKLKVTRRAGTRKK